MGMVAQVTDQTHRKLNSTVRYLQRRFVLAILSAPENQ
jgi:hypothetical protein